MKFTISSTQFKRIFALICCFAVIVGSSCVSVPVSAPTATEMPVIEDSVLEKNTDTIDENTLYLNMPKTIDSLNPLGSKNETMRTLLSLIFEPAIRMNADGSFSSGLIESWKIDESGLMYTFSVRRGVSFHDSNYGYVRSSDFKEIIDLLTSEEGKDSPYAAYASAVDYANIIDEYTFTVKAKEKNLDLLCFMCFPVVPADLYLHYALDAKSAPIGTGPYRFVEFDAWGRMILNRNESWWKSTPNIETIIAEPVENDAEAIHRYQKNELNCILTSLINAKNLCNDSSTTIFSPATSQFDCLIPNINSKNLAKKETRQAISAALDRKRIIMNVLGGMGTVCETPFLSDFAYLENTDSMPENLDSAHDLMKKAGFTAYSGQYFNEIGTALSLDLIYSESEDIPYKKRIVSEIVRQMKNFGIVINPLEMSANNFASALKNGNFDLALASFNLKKNHDISFMFEDGYCRYTSDTLKDQLAFIKTLGINDDLTKAFSALNVLLSDELPMIGLYRKCSAMFIRDHYQNIQNTNHYDMFANIADWTSK